MEGGRVEWNFGTYGRGVVGRERFVDEEGCGLSVGSGGYVGFCLGDY